MVDFIKEIHFEIPSIILVENKKRKKKKKIKRKK
jgi:hypothetical protein